MSSLVNNIIPQTSSSSSNRYQSRRDIMQTNSALYVFSFVCLPAAALTTTQHDYVHPGTHDTRKKRWCHHQKMMVFSFCSSVATVQSLFRDIRIVFKLVTQLCWSFHLHSLIPPVVVVFSEKRKEFCHSAINEAYFYNSIWEHFGRVEEGKRVLEKDWQEVHKWKITCQKR